MRIGVPREIYAGEKRVATTPDVAAQLIKLGFDVAVESNAGAAANYSDKAYEKAGCSIVLTADDIWADSEIILKVRGPEDEEASRLKAGQTLISFLWPAQNPELLQNLTARGVTAMAMDSVPRISRAQKVDALSSMANIAGYRAVVEAAQHFGRFFTGQITAAGKVHRPRCWSSAPALPGWPLLAPPRPWVQSFVPSILAPRSRNRLRAWMPSS